MVVPNQRGSDPHIYRQKVAETSVYSQNENIARENNKKEDKSTAVQAMNTYRSVSTSFPELETSCVNMYLHTTKSYDSGRKGKYLPDSIIVFTKEMIILKNQQ